MQRNSFLLVLVVIQVVCLLQMVHAKCRVELLMQSYGNPSEHDYGGSCCDALCVGQCDHRFTFCLDRQSQSTDTTVCEYFTKSTWEFPNQNVINFGDNMKGVANPMIKDFDTCPDGARFKVHVLDDDSRVNDLVDKLFYTITWTPYKTKTLSSWTPKTVYGIRRKDKTTLGMSSRVYCLPNYYGSRCETFCVATDSTSGHYRCDPDTGSYICNNGWEDPTSKCTVFADDCHNVTCQNGGTCVDGLRSYTCTCLPGFTGVNCEVDIDECASDPCNNGGKCTQAVDSFTCDCPPEYVGTQCQYHVCEVASPCLNNGACYESGSCLCLPGFTGNDCGDHLCDIRQCKNNGSCVRDSGHCDCTDDFTGDSCGVDKCSLITCENSGTCDRGRCLCPPAFTGSYCHKQIDECSSNPCQNRAPCIDGLGSYLCKCLPGFDGTNCQDISVGVGNGPSGNTLPGPSDVKLLQNTFQQHGSGIFTKTWILLQEPIPIWALVLVVIIAVLIIIIIIILGLCWRRKRNARRKLVEASRPVNELFNNPAYSSDASVHSGALTRPVPGKTIAFDSVDEDKKFDIYEEIKTCEMCPNGIPEKLSSTQDDGYVSPSTLKTPPVVKPLVNDYESPRSLRNT